MKMQNLFRGVLLLVIIAAPSVAYAADEPVRGITPGRLFSIIAGIAGLVSVIVGGRALRAVNHNGAGRPGAIVALVTGSIGAVLSGVHLSRSFGAALGTGSGKLGAIIALVIGLVGILLGGLALARYRRKNNKS
jgi:hypothetical protein